jgi:hypothetical protein
MRLPGVRYGHRRHRAHDDVVIWHSLGWQTDYDQFVDYELFADLAPYRFSAIRYDAVLRRLLTTQAEP